VCRAAASSPFEVPQDLLRERRVEVVRNLELPSAEAERTRTGLRCCDRAKLSNGPPLADHEEMFSGLNAI
jgi:hypothetical protein